MEDYEFRIQELESKIDRMAVDLDRLTDAVRKNREAIEQLQIAKNLFV